MNLYVDESCSKFAQPRPCMLYLTQLICHVQKKCRESLKGDSW